MATDSPALAGATVPLAASSSAPIHGSSEPLAGLATESATQTANNTAVCTPVAASARNSDAADISGDFTKVADSRQHSANLAAHQRAMHDSPTHYVMRKQALSGGGQQKPWPEPALGAEAAAAAASGAHLQGGSADHNANMYTNGSVCDRQLHSDELCPEAMGDACAGHESDLTRHPTLVFDQSPFFRA
ncbi:hypothetical protein H4S01_002309, partial [Coemansia sp. RSA 2610]